MQMTAEPGSIVRRTARSHELVSDCLEGDPSCIRETSESGDGSSQGFELREDPAFWKDHNVQVIIRIRPLNSSEISLQGQNRCVRQDSCQTLTWIGHPESRFTFDLIADEHVSQERLFKVAGVPMVENCMVGYNSCIFAYGQTGSGKTHTMLGDIEEGMHKNGFNSGITPRVFEYLFSRIQKEKENQSYKKLHFTCRCSFLEIYNEQILDLLDPSSINLQIREDAKRGVHVENLKEYEVSSPRDVIQQLIQGAANRKVAATNMNCVSSRSHSVFTCVIERKWESQGVTHHRFARLNLVDLAGSERQKSSGAEGERLKEATNINKSLSTLGLVILNLSSSSTKRPLHVPYRDSKLTFLLQESLGGNSKTLIIANISPSNCCTLETLSTLKFAQRSKFVRNNAIINEESSGDALTMQLQIQQLKKEVNRLRGLINRGVEGLGSDGLIASEQGSPTLLKWTGEQEKLSPLTFDKRLSPRKEYEAALVAALRRIHDKEEELKALAAERAAADQLVIHRTEEVRNLKLRLRFREDAIKRLEALASEKLLPEARILQEKEDLLKELEVLRNQVERNPEVTRFAMENMQLREELRRLKSFVEDGEREKMNEQISILQDKLLEALDWKLMHEKSSQSNPMFTWDSFAKEENEFLRMEAMQNHREVEALRKSLTDSLEAKEKLERRVDELTSQLEEQKEAGYQSMPAVSDDQIELKEMVDAIAVASQREAEAHETTITLARENDVLRMKIKVLIEDNNKLMELCGSFDANAATNGTCDAYLVHGEAEEKQQHDYLEDEKVRDMEHQLNEMLEENEKLMGLYEKAMQERDDFKRMLAAYELARNEARDESSCPEKLVEVDEIRILQSQNEGEFVEEHGRHQLSEMMPSSVKAKLDLIAEKLVAVHNVLKLSGLLERTAIEMKAVHSRIDDVLSSIFLKQQEATALVFALSDLQETRVVIDNKFLSLKTALQKFSSKLHYLGETEVEAKDKFDSCLALLNQKKEELTNLFDLKSKVDITCVKARQSESELKTKIDCLKTQLQVTEARRKESEGVLFSIDNLENSGCSEPGGLKIGKASDLLRLEEERAKHAMEMKKLREKQISVQKTIAKSRSVSESLNAKIEKLEASIESELALSQEAEAAWLTVSSEKQMLCRMMEDGMVELGKVVVDYQECLFGVDLKQVELLLCGADMQEEMKGMEEMKIMQKMALEDLHSLVVDNRCSSKQVEEQLEQLLWSITDIKVLVHGCT